MYLFFRSRNDEMELRRWSETVVSLSHDNNDDERLVCVNFDNLESKK